MKGISSTIHNGKDSQELGCSFFLQHGVWTELQMDTLHINPKTAAGYSKKNFLMIVRNGN